jgi:hypothetical protein
MTIRRCRVTKRSEPLRVSFGGGSPSDLPQLPIKAGRSVPGRLRHGPQFPAKLHQRQVTLTRIARPASRCEIALLKPRSAKRTSDFMVDDGAVSGDGGVGLPSLPVRVVGEVFGEDDTEQRHHGIKIVRPPQYRQVQQPRRTTRIMSGRGIDGRLLIACSPRRSTCSSRRSSAPGTASATSPTTAYACCCTAASAGRRTGPQGYEAACHAWWRKTKNARRACCPPSAVTTNVHRVG